METALSSHLAKCIETSNHTRRSLDELKECTKKTEESVQELKAERDKRRGVVSGLKTGASVLVGVVTVISILLNIYYFLIK